MKNEINEHDMTKTMLNIMRGGHKNLLTEYYSAPNTEVGDDVIQLESGNAEFNGELQKLKDIVDSSAMISTFKIYPTVRNVVMEGHFLKNEQVDSGINFVMGLNAGEVKIQMVGQNDLNANVSEILTKLKGYYSVWVNEWNKKIDTEYKPRKE